MACLRCTQPLQCSPCKELISDRRGQPDCRAQIWKRELLLLGGGSGGGGSGSTLLLAAAGPPHTHTCAHKLTQKRILNKKASVSAVRYGDAAVAILQGLEKKKKRKGRKAEFDNDLLKAPADEMKCVVYPLEDGSYYVKRFDL